MIYVKKYQANVFVTENFLENLWIGSSMNLKLIFSIFSGLQLLMIVITIASPEEAMASFGIEYSSSMAILIQFFNCYSTDGCFDNLRLARIAWPQS